MDMKCLGTYCPGMKCPYLGKLALQIGKQVLIFINIF